MLREKGFVYFPHTTRSWSFVHAKWMSIFTLTSRNFWNFRSSWFTQSFSIRTFVHSQNWVEENTVMTFGIQRALWNLLKLIQLQRECFSEVQPSSIRVTMFITSCKLLLTNNGKSIDQFCSLPHGVELGVYLYTLYLLYFL